MNDELRLMPTLSIVAGVRLDDHVDSFGLVLAPRAALIGHFYEGATTKLMVSRSFRAPSVYERYYTDGISEVPALNLQPELGLSAELEHTHPITDEASITGAVFYGQLSPHRPGERSDGFLQYQNLAGHHSHLGRRARGALPPGAAAHAQRGLQLPAHPR